MEGRDQIIRQLTELKRQLSQEREKLMVPVREIDATIEHIKAALAICLHGSDSDKVDAAKRDKPEVTNSQIGKLRGMTQMEAVVEIAKHFGGILYLRQAVRIMVQAGVMANTKNVKQMVTNAVKRTGRFERIGRGEYRLKPPPPKNLTAFGGTYKSVQ